MENLIGSPNENPIGNPTGNSIGNPNENPIGNPIEKSSGSPNENSIENPVGHPSGNPIGKKMGDMLATDVEGNEIDGKVPDVFYLGDKTGEDKLVATTFFNAFAPKAPVEGTAGAAQEEARA